MTSNQRIDEFLKLQNKGISLDEIASTLGIKPQTLKRDLNKNGYKSVKGKYIKKDEKSQNVSIQVSFVDNELNQKKDTFFNDIAIFLYLIIGSKIHFFKKGEKHEKNK